MGTGIAYYKDLITKLKENNIEPIVTMHHWDQPTALENEGGFLNEVLIDYKNSVEIFANTCKFNINVPLIWRLSFFKSIITAFVDYATILFENFGDQVKWWSTFNEPRQTCAGGYDYGGISPQKLNPGRGGYICSHNLLRAHAKAYRVYDEQFRATQNGINPILVFWRKFILIWTGKVSMVIDEPWYEPASNSTQDLEAAERINLMTVSTYLE